MAESPDAAATLGAQQPVLALFAQALAGRPITLPSPIRGFANERDHRAAYRIAVMRLALADHDDEWLQAALGAGSVSWRRVFRSLERLRIDAAIARDYPGAVADLTQQRIHELVQRRQAAPRRWPLTRTVDALWRHALGDMAANAETPLSPAVRQLVDTLSEPDAGPLDSAHAASQLCEALGVPALARRHVRCIPGDPPTVALAMPGANPADLRKAGAGLATQDASTASASTQANGMAQVGASGANPAWHQTSATTQPRAASRARTKPLGTQADSPATDQPLQEEGDSLARAHAVDEWDYRQQRLLPHWCSLIERRLHGADRAFIHRVRRRHAELSRRVHRQFAAWRPEGLQRVHGAIDGDEIELDRVIEAVVDRRAGVFDDRAWYVRRDRVQREVATAFLVDTSASTDFVLPDAANVGPPRPPPSLQADAVYMYDLSLAAPPPEPPKRRVIDVAKDAIALMCDALHTLGDRFAVYTFSGHGRSQVDFRVVKSFDEVVSSRTAGAIAALRPHGATRTGTAIRHAAAQLARQSQRRRVLIVVTDGYPEDIDYGPTPRDLRYGLEDTAHALLEAQASGVHTFCLSIDPAGHDYLRRMCPPQRYGVLSDLAALPGELAKVYQAMTRPAS